MKSKPISKQFTKTTKTVNITKKNSDCNAIVFPAMKLARKFNPNNCNC